MCYLGLSDQEGGKSPHRASWPNRVHASAKVALLVSAIVIGLFAAGCAGVGNDSLARDVYLRQGYSLKTGVECFDREGMIGGERYNRVCVVTGATSDTLHLLVSGTNWSIVTSANTHVARLPAGSQQSLARRVT